MSGAKYKMDEPHLADSGRSRWSLKMAALLGVAITVGAPAAAFAQQTSRSQSNPGASSADQTEVIVVTAQKRGEQNVTDVPISVAVVRGTQLEQSGARGVADALNNVGGVNLIQESPGRSTISIRGASAGSVTLTGSAPVGYYLDELPFAFITNAFLPDANAFDLKRVEVLRGPQGTLYGASSLNGVVRILTNDADMNNFQVRGRTSYASTQDGGPSSTADFVVNVPLVAGRLGVRAVASYADLGGFIDAPDATNFNDSTVGNYRIKINAAPTENLSVSLGAWFSRIDNHGSSEARDDYTTPFPNDQDVKRNYDAYNLIVGYDLPSISIQSSTGYINLTGRGNYDLLLGGALETSLSDALGAKLFTEEVRVASHFDGPWQVTGGVFYRNVDQLLTQGIFDLGIPFPLSFRDKSQSWAAFGELTRAFMDGKLEVTGGLRYFEDTVKTDELSTLFTGTAGPLFPEVQSDFDHLTWRLVANYHPVPNQTLYASVATGFRSGFNQAPTSLEVEPNLGPVRADSLITYEVGAKGETSNGRFYYDTALYYTDWNGPQQLRLTSLGSAAVINAGSASGWGVDATLTARLTDAFSVHGGLGWNSLEFDSDTFQQGAVLFPKGDRLNLSPELTLNAGAEYRQSIGNGLQGFVATEARYSSRMVTHDVVGGMPVIKQSDNITNVDLRAGVDADHWSLTAFADNLTDERGAVEPGSTSLPYPVRQRPRTIGLQLTFTN